VNGSSAVSAARPRTKASERVLTDSARDFKPFLIF